MNIEKPTQLHEMVCLGDLSKTAGVGNESPAGLEAPLHITPAGHFSNREGFDPEFLSGIKVSLPKLVDARQGDEAPLLAGSSPVLKYHHFSIIMSKSRKLAIFTACNIDGKKSKKLTRAEDKWFYDGRISTDFQIGEGLYTGNRLDRGHLVRRGDPVWGAAASAANDDTFHFTNCSPQFDDFNQVVWLGLENYLLNNSRAHDLQISVLTGPVFRRNDMLYRGVRIPREYWKVVALVTEKGRPSVTAYKVSQSDLLKEDLEFVFGRYKTYQVSVKHVEKLASVDFGKLKQHDGFSTQESVTGGDMVVELTDWREIRV
ncbi:MAG: DNA/RNA non-specific endonuclease [Burkholderiales bacterium]